jgi:hypothetical protein
MRSIFFPGRQAAKTVLFVQYRARVKCLSTRVLHSHLARAIRSAHDSDVEERIEQPYFEEEQHFPPWIKAIALLPVAILGCPAILMWLEGPRFVLIALIFSSLALVLLVLAIPNFVIKLLIRLDSSYLHLRIYPLKLPVPFLPPRIRDVPLDDISHWEVRTYKPLLDRDYWGTHFWSLGSAFGGGRYLYMMKVNPTSGRGVQLQLRSDERLLVGSKHPEELANAITRAKFQLNKES